MSSGQMGAKPDTEASLHAGAIAIGLIGLLPYMNVLSSRPTSLAQRSRFGTRWRAAGNPRRFKDGAKLGFFSTFLGSMMAVVVDLIWVFFDYQLWQHQNQEFMMAIVRRFARPSTVDAMNEAFVQSNARIFRSCTLLLQLAANAFLYGIFGPRLGCSE